MVREGKVTANNGEDITLAPGSVCVHGDDAKALAFVQKIHAALDAAGVAVTAF